MSKPTPPDGSDPRVVTPDPDEPEVEIVGAERSSSQAYHIYPDACDKINRSTTTRTVPKSVAEWQGNDLCERCAALDAAPDRSIDVADADHTSGLPVSRGACHALRREVSRGHDARAVSDAIGLGKSTAYVHLRGECDHDTAAPPCAYDEATKTWRAADE